MLVPSCILDDPLVNPNGLNDCVTGICYDDTSSNQYCNALEASQPGACSTYVQCQCIVPNEDWRPLSPPPPVDCSGLIPDGGRCGEDVPGAGICRHCCGATGFCGSSGLYCDVVPGVRSAKCCSTKGEPCRILLRRPLRRRERLPVAAAVRRRRRGGAPPRRRVCRDAP